MIRTQIQITSEQAQQLKRIAAREGISVAELIRRSIDILLRANPHQNNEEIRKRALSVVGKLEGPTDMSSNHDGYFEKAIGL